MCPEQDFNLDLSMSNRLNYKAAALITQPPRSDIFFFVVGPNVTLPALYKKISSICSRHSPTFDHTPEVIYNTGLFLNHHK